MFIFLIVITLIFYTTIFINFLYPIFVFERYYIDPSSFFIIYYKYTKVINSLINQDKYFKFNFLLAKI